MGLQEGGLRNILPHMVVTGFQVKYGLDKTISSVKILNGYYYKVKIYN